MVSCVRAAAPHKCGHSLIWKQKHGLYLYNLLLPKNKLRYCYFFFVWLWEVRVLAGKRWRGDAGACRPHPLSSELFFLILLFVGWGLLAHVAQVRVRIGFGGQRLLAAAAGRQQLPFLGVPPLHPPVLEPDFHLWTGKRAVSGKGLNVVFARKWRTACWPFYAHAEFFFYLFIIYLFMNYLWVLQAQFRGQLLSVGLADVFLFLEHLLQGFALHVGEHRPPQHPSAGFSSGGQGPRKRPGDGNNGWRC